MLRNSQTSNPQQIKPARAEYGAEINTIINKIIAISQSRLNMLSVPSSTGSPVDISGNAPRVAWAVYDSIIAPAIMMIWDF